MTTITTTRPQPIDLTVTETVATAPATRRRNTWALWGVVAAAAGAVSIGTGLQSSKEIMDAAARGPEVIDLVNHTGYHVSVVAGFVVVAALLFTAAGWRRWAAARAGDSLPASVFSSAFAASAGAAMLGYGFYGSLAIYSPGGMDEGTFPHEALYAIYAVVDFAPLLAWWGVTVAALCMVWMSLRERRFVRWMGVVSAVLAFIPLALLVGTGLPGMPGLVGPIWLAIISLGTAFRKEA